MSTPNDAMLKLLALNAAQMDPTTNVGQNRIQPPVQVPSITGQRGKITMDDLLTLVGGQLPQSAVEGLPAQPVDAAPAVLDQMVTAPSPLATDLNQGLTVQQYRDQEIRAERVPEFTNVPGAEGYQIPDTYGEAVQGAISGNLSIIGRDGIAGPTAEAFLPGLSANSIRAYKPEGENDLDKYNNLQRYIVDVKGQVRTSASEYDASLRNPATERLEQLARFQYMNKNYDGYNETQAQLRMFEQERQSKYADTSSKMFTGHVQALEAQEVELGILRQRAGIVAEGQRAQAKYDRDVGQMSQEQKDVVNRLSVMNASTPVSEIGKMKGDTDNPAKNQFARMTLDGQLTSYEDVAIHGAFIYKDPITNVTTALSMRETTDMYKRLAVDKAIGTEKKDQIDGIIDAQYAAYKKGLNTYKSDIKQQEIDTKLLRDKPTDRAAAISRNAEEAGIAAMRGVAPLLVKATLTQDLTKLLPPEYFAVSTPGLAGRGMNDITQRAQTIMAADKALSLGAAYDQAAEMAAGDPASPVYQASWAERSRLLMDLRPHLLDQLTSTMEGTGITVSDLDLSGLGNFTESQKIMLEQMR